ncbi:MAG: hypothetical protein JW751_06570, partial [Polyangiaceae bacterium]|nr:hypothetical protein [Polyangiaceae bacterium]
MADAVSGPRRRARLGLARIVELETRKIAARLTDRGIELVLTPEATAFIAEAGHDPTFGARPLKRYLQQHV